MKGRLLAHSIFHRPLKSIAKLGSLGATCLCCLLSSGASHAYSTPVGLSLGVGTLGTGASVTYNIEDRFGVRIAANSYEFDKKIYNDGVSFDSNIELNGVSATLDWYPWLSYARLSVGLISNSSKVIATPYANNLTLQVNDTEIILNDAGLTEAEVTFAPISTYLGIGWGNAGKGEGLSLFADLGVVLQGTPDVSLSIENQIELGLTAEDLHAQERRYEKDLKRFRFYPVVTVGVSYNL